MTERSTDVAILGGGVAGLTAAAELTREGFHVTIIEARPRLGGRIATVRRPDLPAPVELGAEFIHGKPEQTWRIVHEAGLETYEMSGEMWYASKEGLSEDENVWEKTEELFEEMKGAARREDRTLASYLEEYRAAGGDEEAAGAVTGFVEGFHAAPVDRVGIRGLVEASASEEEIEGDRAFRLADGYEALVAAIRERIDPERSEILPAHVATDVRWGRDTVAVVVRTPDGQRTIEARRLLITLPIGVLQAEPGSEGSVRFDPELPDKQRAIEGIGMGAVVKITYRFRERFWESGLPAAPSGASTDGLGFLLSDDRTMPTWWSWQPLKIPYLTGWAGGTAAMKLAELSRQEIVARSLDALSRVSGIDRTELEELVEEWFMHDWNHDPYARGAYSYLPVGGIEARAALARPIEGTLFFAGEATNVEGETGTVHGAIASGERAAGEIAGSLR